MTTLEGIVGLIASIFAILGGLWIVGHHLGKRIDARFDRWVETTVDNTAAMRRLTERVDKLEHTIGNSK